MRITVNGEGRELETPLTVSGLLAELGLDAGKIAVERNRELVRRSVFDDTVLDDGDALEIVHFIGGGSPVTSTEMGADDDSWSVATRHMRSRLIVGTGKYKDVAETEAALSESGAEVVTVGARGAIDDTLEQLEVTHPTSQLTRVSNLEQALVTTVLL